LDLYVDLGAVVAVACFRIPDWRGGFRPDSVKGLRIVSKLCGSGGLYENGGMDVRMDKWLWAARFFKTRALASRACDLGRIEANTHAAKAARMVKVGDMVRVTNEGGVFLVEVLGVSEVRGPSAVAQTLYRETDESRELRSKVAEERRVMIAGGGVDGEPAFEAGPALDQSVSGAWITRRVRDAVAVLVDSWAL
jgi:ribosome-associated heat shock protein Hsp15